MTEKEMYLVLELGTGLVDGWYIGKASVEGMCDYWDEARFPYRHVVVELADLDRDGKAYLPDRMMMNRQPEIIEAIA